MLLAALGLSTALESQNRGPCPRSKWSENLLTGGYTPPVKVLGATAGSYLSTHLWQASINIVRYCEWFAHLSDIPSGELSFV